MWTGQVVIGLDEGMFVSGFLLPRRAGTDATDEGMGAKFRLVGCSRITAHDPDVYHE